MKKKKLLESIERLHKINEQRMILNPDFWKDVEHIHCWNVYKKETSDLIDLRNELIDIYNNK